MGYDTGFAKSCFPTRATSIDDLAARDEDFRELCYDFAAADELRRDWANSSNPKRDERCAESVELVENLRIEIEAALDKAAIIPFQRRPK